MGIVLYDLGVAWVLPRPSHAKIAKRFSDFLMAGAASCLPSIAFG